VEGLLWEHLTHYLHVRRAAGHAADDNMSDEEAGEIKLPSTSNEPRPSQSRVRYEHAMSAWLPTIFLLHSVL